jgi:cytoskeletal protein RodZ
MKLKDVFLGVLIVALIASEILLYSANQQKSAAQDKLKQAQHDVQQVRADLEQANADNAADQTSLHAENQSLTKSLAQLRNENTSLRTTNQKLETQLGTARTAVQLQQQHLEQLQVDSQQAAAADQAACINNLQQINTAKAQWALENGKTANDIPTEDDLLVYLPGGIFPLCPSGGTYTIGAAGNPPTCSIPGHVLPQ